jgi:hypothetical protein
MTRFVGKEDTEEARGLGQDREFRPSPVGLRGTLEDSLCPGHTSCPKPGVALMGFEDGTQRGGNGQEGCRARLGGFTPPYISDPLPDAGRAVPAPAEKGTGTRPPRRFPGNGGPVLGREPVPFSASAPPSHTLYGMTCATASVNSLSLA